MANELIINGALTPVVFSKLMRRNLDPQSVFYDLVNRDYEGEIKNKGDRVVIRQAGDITVKDYVKGTPMEYEDPEANKMELVIDQKKYFAFDIEDIDQVQSDISGLVQKYIDRAQTEISLVKDTYISTKIWDGIHDGNMLETVTLTKDNAYGTLTKLMGRLRWTSAIKNNGTGYDGKRPWLVVDPDVFGVLLETPQATKATEAGDKTTREGTVLRLAGFDIKVSNHSEDGAATRKIIAGTTEGFSYADQIAKTKIETDKDDFAQHASGLYLFGGVATQEKALAGLQVTLA